MNNPNPRANSFASFLDRYDSLFTLLLAVATFLLAFETYGLQAEIEDARTHKSIDLLLTAVDKLGNGVHCAHFFGDISDEERKNITHSKGFNINSKDFDLLNMCLAGSVNKESQLFDPSKNKLTNYGSAYIARQIEHDMNLLNIIAAAYYSAGSNKKLIKETLGGYAASEGFKVFIEKPLNGQDYHELYLYRFIAENYDYIPKAGSK